MRVRDGRGVISDAWRERKSDLRSCGRPIEWDDPPCVINCGLHTGGPKFASCPATPKGCSEPSERRACGRGCRRHC